ncbi:MAG: hypothetical protein KF726_07405 [Anaerolineae bacterium]|nr:hypothetical protein [Anaerolineae bacterium]
MPISKFEWKDRDSAAFDLIQLAKQQPTTEISIRALNALQAIRSDEIADELGSVALDPTRKFWERIYALRAYTELSGDRYTPQFRLILEENIESQEDSFPTNGEILGKFVEICRFAEFHQSNRAWLLAFIDQVNPAIAHMLLLSSLDYYFNDEMRSILSDRLLRLLDRYPQFIDVVSILTIANSQIEDGEIWLDKHFPEVVQVCLTSVEHELMYLHWERLKQHLSEVSPALADIFAQTEQKSAKLREDYQKRATHFHQDDAMWQHCKKLYLKAKVGDQTVLAELCLLATNEREDIPLRATATHFLGKLQEKEGVIEILCSLIQEAQDEWKADVPVRFEAGEALSYSASPIAWQAILNTLLQRPHNELFLTDWLSYLTDQLSGIYTVYSGCTYSNRRWINLDWDQRLFNT